MTNQKRLRAGSPDVLPALALFSLVELLVPPGGGSYKLLSNKMSDDKKKIVARLIRKRIGRGKIIDTIYIVYEWSFISLVKEISLIHYSSTTRFDLTMINLTRL